MEPERGATAPPFIVTAIFVGLTLPSALTNGPVTPSIYDANDQYPAAVPSSDIEDLSKSQRGNIVINQNLQQPETDGISEDNLQQQDGNQHSFQLKNMLPGTEEETPALQNTFDTENVEAENQQSLFISKEEDSTAQSSRPDDQHEANDTFSTNENSNKELSTGDATTLMQSFQLKTVNREQDSDEHNITNINTNLVSASLTHDNMPFVTHLDGEASIEQRYVNGHSEEFEFITPQPQVSVAPSKLWYLDGTQHSNVNDNMEKSGPSVHDEKLDNELLATLDNPIIQHGNPSTLAEDIPANSNKTESLGPDEQPPHQSENELYGDKTDSQNDFNDDLIKPNMTLLAANNHEAATDLDSSPINVEENLTVNMMYHTITAAVNTSVSKDSLLHPSGISSMLTSLQNTDNETRTRRYHFTLTLTDKSPSLSNHSIQPTPSVLMITNKSVTEADDQSENYYDSVLVSSHWERVFEKRIQHEAVHEQLQHEHSDIAFVEKPFERNTVFPTGDSDIINWTKSSISVTHKLNSSDYDLASTVLKPSFIESAMYAVTIGTMTTPSTVNYNSSGDQSDALLSVIKIIANHMNTKYHLGNELFTTNVESATLVHTEMESEKPNMTENTDVEVVAPAVNKNQFESSTSPTQLSSSVQLSAIDVHNSKQTELVIRPATNVKQCTSEDNTCFGTSMISVSPINISPNNSVENNSTSSTLVTIPVNKPNSINEIDHYNPVPFQTIKPTKSEPSLIGQSVTDTSGANNSTKLYTTSMEGKQPSPTKQMHPNSSTTLASNRRVSTGISFKPTRPSFAKSTPVVLSPPMAYILLIFNVPWITVCLHDKELQESLAEELTNLVNRAIQPQQIILLSTGSQHSTSWVLVNTQADICQELEHTHTSPSLLVVYVVDAMGEADQILTTVLGNGLLHDEIKFSGTAFQNVVLEVRIFPSDTNTITRDGTGPNNYFGLIAAFTISGIAGTSLILLCILLLILRHRHLKYRHHQQCRPVTDNYSLDSISIYSSFRQKRNSKRNRSYLNLGFNDPNVPSHQVNFAGLANVCLDQDTTLEEEYALIPMKSCKLSDLPSGAEEKNRYANIIPIPETRVSLTTKPGEPNSDYINANYVQCFQGCKGRTKKYIACQAPMENTLADFWRMVWEQQSRVIIMLTQFEEDNVPKCVQYFPESEFNGHKVCGDYHVTLKSKEVLQNYTISVLQVRDLERNLLREVTHFWYTAWPPQGTPTENWSVAAMLLEVRSHLFKNTGPGIVHCSTGSGRTGTVIAIDICMREFEDTRMVDIPKCVSNIRKQRGGAVQNKEQYYFIYQVLNEYAIRLINPSVRSSLRTDMSTIKR